jgi:hypothetical protein
MRKWGVWVPLLACPAVFCQQFPLALLDKPAVAPFLNRLLNASRHLAQIPYLAFRLSQFRHNPKIFANPKIPLQVLGGRVDPV